MGLLLTVCISVEFVSCKKDKLITDSDAKLKFSTDSLLFDTVFTQAGSATKQLRVVNKNSQKIKISSIFLESGNSSSFIINVDGAKGNSFSDIEIASQDSIYIFVQVYVNPTNSNNPVIINENLVFNFNGNTKKVVLEAWGQDCYYHRPNTAIKFSDGSYLPYSTVSLATNTTVTWPNDKPHVIYGWVVIDSTQTLILQPKTQLYFYQNAGMWVYRYGAIKVNGQKGSEVVFQGYRRESDYINEPGQWDRLWISEGSLNNEIDYAIIKNAFIGVQADLLNTIYNADERRLKITNTKIFNMKKWGLYSVGYNIYGGNNVISNCRESCVNLTLGGNYKFIHCTFANYWNKDTRTVPCVSINNYNSGSVFPLDTCYFGNSIIDGSIDSELSLDFDYSNTMFPPKHSFNYCVLKANQVTDSHFNNCKFKQLLYFKNTGDNDFSINDNNSAAINFSSGADANLFQFDINGVNRLINPDAGAYKK